MTSEYQQLFTGPELEVAPGSVFGARYWHYRETGGSAPTGLMGAIGWAWNPRAENLAVCRRSLWAPPALAPTFGALKTGAVVTWSFGGGSIVSLVPDEPVITRPEHRAPCEDCECGFYAYWDEDCESPFTPYALYPLVLGVVEGYGKTLIGDLGFRCEKARIRGMCPISTSKDSPGEDLHTALSTMLADPGVPVYADPAGLFAAHPLTTDYRRQLAVEPGESGVAA